MKYVIFDPCMKLYFSETTDGYFGVMHSFYQSKEDAFKFSSIENANEYLALIRDSSPIWDDYELKIVEYDSDSSFSEV